MQIVHEVHDIERIKTQKHTSAIKKHK